MIVKEIETDKAKAEEKLEAARPALLVNFLLFYNFYL